MEGGAARFTAPLQRLFHWVNRNTHEGARRNIAAHYDLGNDFFALFLDREMMYSCAVFPDPDADLDAASVHKLDLVCRKLQLRAGEHVLDVGCGGGPTTRAIAERIAPGGLALGLDVSPMLVEEAQLRAAARTRSPNR